MNHAVLNWILYTKFSSPLISSDLFIKENILASTHPVTASKGLYMLYMLSWNHLKKSLRSFHS